MPWNLLILPLVAGYYLLTHSNYFKYKQQRLDKQRLIFDSVLLGIALIVLTFLIRFFVEWKFEAIITTIHAYFPLKTPFLGTAFATLLVSIFIAEVGNRTTHKDRNKEIKKAIKSVGNELELLLKSSFTDSKLLEFTLDSGKFYIAWVKELPIPTVTNYIRVIPAFSGYRDDAKRLVFTTQYLSVYAEYNIAEGKVQDIKELDVDLIITLDNVVTVSYFDIDMYERFNNKSVVKNKTEEQSESE